MTMASQFSASRNPVAQKRLFVNYADSNQGNIPTSLITTDGLQMIILPYLAALRVSGTDAGQFLHNQLSQDILALNDGESTLACYCEPKGRVLALLLVYRHQQDYRVVMARELATTIVQRLQIYVMRAQVVIEPLAYPVAVTERTDDPAELAELLIQTNLLTARQAQICLLPADPPALDPDTALAEQWHYSELENGVAWLGTNSSGQFLPQMLGFDQIGAVNFKKGCYPGQEIVARSHYLGKVKRHPRRLLINQQNMCLEAMGKIKIHSAGETFDAVLVDSAQQIDGGTCLLAVTRMAPQQVATGLTVAGDYFDCIATM